MHPDGIAPRRRTLRTRIALGLLGYSLALTAALILHGFWVHEAVERSVWRSLLGAELDFLKSQRATDSAFEWPVTDTLRVWSYPRGTTAPADLPETLAALPLGMHDEVMTQAGPNAVMVSDEGDERIVLVLNITEMENAEWIRAAWVLVSALLSSVLLALLVWWLAGRLLRPVHRLVTDIHRMRPDATGQRLSLPESASAEIETITNAMNDYLARHDGFVDRERSFINSASHELRTPIAVIAGAADVLDQRIGSEPSLRAPLERIRHTAAGVEQLIGLLLVLAKEPQRLRAAAETFDLGELLDDLLADHVHLTVGKSLELRLEKLAPSRLHAPAGIVHVAIGNLVRNAIENSDHGIVRIDVEPAGVVHIRDPGSGLSAQEIGRLYVERARQPDRQCGAGLGLELIGRICDHLGWSLRFESIAGRGTHAELDLRRSLAASSDAEP